MSVTLLRQVWGIVEETQAKVLLKLDDTDLVEQLLSQLSSRSTLSTEEVTHVQTYIDSRISLIRDLAQARLVQA
ncbi:MAG TPA: hypothetical protein V6D18_17140 [Thermosynechococcaceae cyanobacterium]